ncbi:MAG: oligosaccharide flippase family protein, partial [Desulfobacterales bacterium]
LQKGVYTTTVREVSAHFNDDPEYIRNFIRTGSLFSWGVYALFGTAVFFGAPILVENWINLKTLDPETAINILRILGIASLLAFPRSFYASLLRGRQRMEFNNAIEVTTSGVQQGGIILILKSGGNLLHVIYWFAACYGLSTLVYFLFSSRLFSLQSLVPGYSYRIIKENWSFTLKMVSISILSLIHNNAEKMIVSKWLPIGMFGYYGFAYGIVSKAGLITSAIAQAAFPSLSASFKADNRFDLMSQYRKLQDLNCFITIPVFAAIPFVSLPLFTYLFNAGTARTLLLPITFLSVGFYMNGTLNLPYQFSLAVGKPEITVRSNIYALFVVLPSTVMLIYCWGLTGAGLSWVVFNLFAYIYIVPRYCIECLKIPVRRWYGHVIKAYFLAGLIYGFAWIFLKFFNVSSILVLIVTYIGASTFFMIGAFFMIGDELKETIFRYMQDIKRNSFLRATVRVSGRNSKS